jgi:hypothetical protein
MIKSQELRRLDLAVEQRDRTRPPPQPFLLRTHLAGVQLANQK